MKAYAQGSRNPAKERLIADHVEVGRRIALRIARRIPSWMSQEDVVAAALLGLAEAAERYDDSRGEPFIAFAEKRIRGAVLDELRRGDLMPRRVRATARRVGETIRRLEQTLGRPPEDEEIAKALGVPIEEYVEDLQVLVHMGFVELAPEVESEASVGLGDSPADQVERSELVRRVRECLPRLPERDARILSLYYVEEFNYAEIGELLGVTESRVCQLHSRALVRLRAEFEAPPTPRPARRPAVARTLPPRREMADGIYTALAGAVAQGQALDVAASNIANAGTAGFKAERVRFAEVLGKAAGRANVPVQAATGSTDQQAGAITTTGNPLDVAIQGKGWFVVDTAQGARFTRAGNLRLDPAGRLATSDGQALRSREGGALSVPKDAGNVAIAADGTVSADGAKLGTILVAKDDGAQLAREGAGRFVPQGAITPLDSPQLAAGALESGNFNVVQGMVDLVRVSRNYEALHRMIESYQQIDDRAARSIGGNG